MLEYHINSNKKIVILFITTGLRTGGAEIMLYKLLSKIDRRQFEPKVISLMDNGTVGNSIEELAIPIYTIGMKQGIPRPADLLRLRHIVLQIKPDLIQGWMYHGNLAAYLSSVFSLQKIPVFWSIHHSIASLSLEKIMTIGIIKLCATFSRFINQIIFVSKKSKLQHETIGYFSANNSVIPNGFDTSVFKPSSAARLNLRQELSLAEETVIIGLLARYHPMKDHANFIKAAALLCENFPDVNFVLAGSGSDKNNQELLNSIQSVGLIKNFHLLGEQSNIPCLTAALDIVTLSSAYGEAFPLVIGEAMSCGVPCVVTNVGDSGWIVGDTGRVVPPRNPEALANAWQELITLGREGREALGKLSRARINDFFSLESVVIQYEKLYKALFIR
ncbi:MAG: glycosyltransferase [Stigonema ocellatum SAG 48.90 = DSM 106950]|nr:glycosyltransferase [Stigonema ocellatum SAG 48.90 = DSM 106950]